MPTFTKSAPALGQEAEAVAIHHVAGADLDGVAVLFTDEVDGVLLPDGVALGGVDAEDVRAGLDQRGHALCVVAGVDARAHQIALVGVLKSPEDCSLWSA